MSKVLKLSIALCLISINSLAFSGNKVIYGRDDRKDLYKVRRSLYLDLAESTAGMIAKSDISISEDGIEITSSTLVDRGICATERFAAQPTAASCSGFLVAPDLLVTAGHCITSQSDCDANKWVFGYGLSRRGQKEIKVLEENVYGCKEIVSRTLEQSTLNDYALIRLDREVMGRSPLKFRRSGKVKNKQRLVVIGHPSGLPTKVSDRASVRANDNKVYFSANLDTFGGNSGSAVFNADTGIVEGVLVRGEQDYEYDWDKGCRVVFKCSNKGCRGEDITRITNIKELMK